MQFIIGVQVHHLVTRELTEKRRDRSEVERQLAVTKCFFKNSCSLKKLLKQLTLFRASGDLSSFHNLRVLHLSTVLPGSSIMFLPNS